MHPEFWYCFDTCTGNKYICFYTLKTHIYILNILLMFTINRFDNFAAQKYTQQNTVSSLM